MDGQTQYPQGYAQMVPPPEAPARGKYLLPAAIIIAALLIAGAILYIYSQPKATDLEVVEETPINIAGNAPSLGSPDAPVTIVEFGDFQCVYCRQFFIDTEAQIIENYVKTGKARFVYRHFAFLGPESEWAAAASNCANDQGKFWEYHDYLYTHQQGENGSGFTKDRLKQFGRAVGLNAAQFDFCVDSDKHLAAVRQDTADGREFGVTGTPANFVNNQMVTGAIPFTQFAGLIEAELAK